MAKTYCIINKDSTQNIIDAFSHENILNLKFYKNFIFALESGPIKKNFSKVDNIPVAFEFLFGYWH